MLLKLKRYNLKKTCEFTIFFFFTFVFHFFPFPLTRLLYPLASAKEMHFKEPGQTNGQNICQSVRNAHITVPGM